MSEEKLAMSFDPNTIQHLGIKMYSNLPAAIAELIANSYDADASEVHIRLFDNNGEQSISIEDNGNGMSFDEINSCFLRIGRNRRNGKELYSPGGRRVTGKKGLGKLALFGIGAEISVCTKKKGSHECVSFSMKWNDILASYNNSYEPVFEKHDDASTLDGYTKINISQLKRKTKFDPKLPETIAKMFTLYSKDFRIFFHSPSAEIKEIDRKLMQTGIDLQFTWNFPDENLTKDLQYKHKSEVTGQITTSTKPLKPHLRGITLYANGRLVNLPEFFGHAESSHFYSYSTGTLSVDFVDNDKAVGDDDLISTNRQSLDWEKDETQQLRAFLYDILTLIQKDWRDKRKEINKDTPKKETGIDCDKWLSTVPQKEAAIIQQTIDDISDPETTGNPVNIVIQAFHQVVPEYAELHWRFLNEHIKTSDAVNSLYRDKHYFQAASEAVKLYIRMVRKISCCNDPSDFSMMMNVFSEDANNAKISLTNRTDGIEKDIEKGHKHYSGGLVSGFKNPVSSHCTEDELRERGLFDNKACLDILSLLSHLFERLDKRISPREEISQ